MARSNPPELNIAEPVRFKQAASGYGPDTTIPCLCGSQIPARSCHQDSDGRWYARSPPLLTGDRTGHRHPGCYAGASKDCSTKLSREHWLGEGMLEAVASPTVQLHGLVWANGGTVDLRPKALASKILCERHNRALSPLDSTALNVFNAIRRFDDDLRAGEPAVEAEIVVAGGEIMQLWLLKLAWGILTADVLPGHERHEGRLRPLATGSDDWAEILFRGRRWPAGWGMYGHHLPNMQTTPMGHLQLEMKYGPDGSLWSMAVELGPVALHLMLGVPDPGLWQSTHHPGGVVLRSHHSAGPKVIAFTWRDGGGNPLFIIWQGAGAVADRSPSGSPRVD